MAKVSLRIYNREIEGLIDQAHINEAIAHCHHILKTFPKHLATYRLLGKAYLELKRYNDAIDIFSRILMSVPDDFVAHVGMSIIRDEENKLDDAIWHMQRAFEAQPSNSAIQGELQRLYGRRDGMEPPKIRMTRGALAHMYVQGELYPQAIAEIRAVLAQEPDRTDMQVLLARAYFHGGQKADASDMCMQLLKRYLYCFDANCIMVDLLPATAGAVESTQVYRMRVGELDPYTAFAKGSVFQANEVPDASINLERLDYKDEEPPATQSWGSSSLGLSSGASSAPMLSSSNSEPDWLKQGSTQSSDQGASSEGIPDFLRAAGWGESTNPEQPSSFFDEEPAGGDLTPADIPDWLKGQVPTNVSQPTAPQPASAQSIETPDWLSGLDSGSGASSKPADIPDWLSGLGTAGAVAAAASTQPEPTPAQPGNVPDWLSGLGDAETTPEPVSSIPPAQPGNVPDWLSGLGDVETTPEPVSSIPPAQPGNVPDWLSGLGDSDSSTSAKPAQTDDVSDWLSGLDAPSTPAASAPASPAQPSSDVPEWLSGLGDAETADSIQSDDVSDWLSGLDAPKAATPAPAPSGDVPDWLRDIDDSQTPSGNGPDSLFASSQPIESTQSDVPEWMSGLGEAGQPATSQSSDLPAWMSGVPDAPSDETAQTGETSEWVHSVDAPSSAPSIESLGSTAQEQDDAVAWLESLAAKHGAKPEELVTDPNKRSETPPEWVSQAQNIEQQVPVAQTPAPVESLGSTAQEQDDAVAWLESLAAKHGAKPEELVTDPNKRSEIPPEWVSQAQNIEQQVPIAQTPAPSVESLGSTAQEQDDAVAWLESLAAKHGAKPEELVTDPNKRSETPPEWVSQATNIEQQTPVAQTPAPSIESLGSTAQEQDDAVAWLESLAAKHGAKPEELVTDPNKRGETPPDWVSQAQSIGEAQASQKAEEEKPVQSEAVENALNIGEQLFAEFENASKGIPSSAGAGEETEAWLRKFEEQENQAEFPPQPEAFEKQGQHRNDIPDWLNDTPQSGTDNQFDFSDQSSDAQKSELPSWLSGVEDDSFTQGVAAEQSKPQNDLSNWLNSLDNEPGLPFDEMPTPDSILNASKASSRRKPMDDEPVMKKPDLPDWLNNADSQDDAVLEDDWQKPIETSASRPTEEPVTANETENLPDWLQSIEDEESAIVDEDSPRLADRPASPADWKHVEAQQTPEPKKEVPPVETRKPFVPPPAEPRVEAQPQMERPVVEERRAPEKPSAPSRKKAGLPAKQRQAEGQGTSASLGQAKAELDRGDIPAALDHYRKLIKKGKHLDETIRDLTESIYRYPVEVGIWQTLGDAYMRANRLKEALEAYNKAEELIR
ncbi:tetratricopeptide repeat protein [Candidatus Villigracilis affinis]|uniref:tetratricopeptide repeat protein n=1 Tax=Candidatus Villigracilis affinis TaxID=3140682 RepID=UPI001D77637B|nr:tetratricopeptide repeat protein [Anaerolineales bacterium]